MFRSQSPFSKISLGWAVALSLPLVWLGWLIYARCGGMFYTLDDPYIHLALAKQLNLGHYGLNPGEVDAPSSSILWPFLLAPWARLPHFDWLPLVINALACGATALLLFSYFSRFWKWWWSAILSLALLYLLNIYGLVFTGLEHSLQVLLVVWLVTLWDRDQPPPLFYWLALLLPLVRYEDAAIAFPLLAYAFWRGQRKAAVASLAASGALLGAFSLFLLALGLDYLPASIMVKSVLGQGHPLGGMGLNALANLFALWPYWCLLLGAMVWLLVRRRAEEVLFLLLGPSLLYLAAGRYGWFGRYEVFFLAYGFLMVCRLLETDALPKVRAVWAVLMVTVLLGFFPVLRICTMLTPAAARNIHDQQYQMSLLNRDYLKAPVAVNDLGWMAYNSGQYVLDLWGLGSREALNYRRSARDGAWMGQLMAAHGVRYAFIYDAWFPRRPASWIKVGVLLLPPPRITPAASVVSLYAVDGTSAIALRAAIRRFQAAGGPGSALVHLVPGAGAPAI